MKKKKKSVPTRPINESKDIVFHMDKYEATRLNKPYIVSASKAGSYSKLEKAETREEEKLKKELKDYTKYDV